jgi:hypothetical protein
VIFIPILRIFFEIFCDVCSWINKSAPRSSIFFLLIPLALPLAVEIDNTTLICFINVSGVWFTKEIETSCDEYLTEVLAAPLKLVNILFQMNRFLLEEVGLIPRRI